MSASLTVVSRHDRSFGRAAPKFRFI
jgi:hypothetical protein